MLIENRIITPMPITKQIIAKHYYVYGSQILEVIRTVYAEINRIHSWAIARNSYLYVSILVSHELGYFSTFKHLYKTAIAHINGLKSYQVDNSRDFLWKENDLSSHWMHIDLMRQSTFTEMCKLVLANADKYISVESESVPHVFDKVYFYYYEQLTDSLLDDHVETFVKMYRMAFDFLQKAIYALNNTMTNEHTIYFVNNQYSLPYLDFMTISGMAFYYGELTETSELITLVKSIVAAITETAPQVLETFCTAIRVHRDIFFSEDWRHFNWRQRLEHLIREKGLIKFVHIPEEYVNRIDTKNEIVRAFGFHEGTGFVHNSFAELFFEFFINHQLPTEKQLTTHIIKEH